MLKSSVEPTYISSELATVRWEQALALFEVSLQMWHENPDLVKRPGQRIVEFMMPLDQVQAVHKHAWG